MSFLRILAGILAGVAVVAGLWAIAWEHPRLACAIMLGSFGLGWGWFIVRSLKNGTVSVHGNRYLRSKSPVAYWGWLGFYIATGLYLVGGGFYALITVR